MFVSSDVDVIREESSDSKPDDDGDIVPSQATPAIHLRAAAAADDDDDDVGGDVGSYDGSPVVETVSHVSHCILRREYHEGGIVVQCLTHCVQSTGLINAGPG